MRKICPFLFSQNVCITPFINSLLQNITVGSLVYSEPDFVKLNSARGWITNSGSPCDSSTTLQDGIMLSPHQTISCLASSERHTSASQFPLFYFKTLILSFSMLLFHSVPCLTPWKLATVIPINFFKLFYCTHAWCKSLMASATILSSLSCMSDTGIDSISKSRYMTVWVGHRTDFRRWMTNPNFRKHVQWCLNVPATFQFWIIRQESIVNEDIRGKPWAM